MRSIIIAVMLFAGAPALAQGTGGDQTSTARQQSATGQSDPDRLICKRFAETGSLVKKRKVCYTARQWTAMNDFERDAATTWVDADVVLVLGPDRGFLPAEVESLKRYLARGGSLLLAVEPKLLRGAAPAFEAEDQVDVLLEHLGLKLTDGVVASTNMVVPLANNRSDRLNVATNRFSSHPSTVVLSRNQEQLRLFTPGAGTFDETGAGEGEPTVIVRTFAQSWIDHNENLELDSNAGESRSARPLAVVAEGGSSDAAWRALIVADASLFADLPVGIPVLAGRALAPQDFVALLRPDLRFRFAIRRDRADSVTHEGPYGRYHGPRFRQ